MTTRIWASFRPRGMLGLRRAWATVATKPGHAWRRVFGHRPGDAVPRGAIAGALVLSAASAWGGWFIDGWQFRGYDVAVNVLANLVILGPGLFTTNFVVRAWRARRSDDELIKLVEPHVLEVLYQLRSQLLTSWQGMKAADSRYPEFPLRVGRPTSLVAALGSSEMDWATLAGGMFSMDTYGRGVLEKLKWVPVDAEAVPRIGRSVRALSRHLSTELIDIALENLVTSMGEMAAAERDLQESHGSAEAVARFRSARVALLGGIQGVLRRIADELPDRPYTWEQPVDPQSTRSLLRDRSRRAVLELFLRATPPPAPDFPYTAIWVPSRDVDRGHLRQE